MNKKRCYIVLTLLCLFARGTLAQNVDCGFDFLQQQLMAADSGRWLDLKGHENRIDDYRNNPPTWQNLYKPPGIAPLSGNYATRFIIPVVVHIDSSQGTVSISSAQVQHQLDAVNEAMKDYNIQLCLAKKRPNGTNFSGINYLNGTSIDNRIGYQLPALTNLVYYNPEKYLNIYVVPTILNANYSTSTYGGYNNSFPGQRGLDAIVMLHTVFGDAQTCSGCNLFSSSRGLTLVHELGHYLGLWHTFEGGCNGGNTATTCAKQGDRCCDTRPVAAESYTCPLNAPTLSCANTAYYTSSFAENRSNHMDYAADPCRTNFTPDQLAIMYSALQGPRYGLISAENLDALALACPIKSAWFTADNNFFCYDDIEPIKLTAFQGGSSYRWIVYDSTRNRLVIDTVTAGKKFTYKPDSVGNYNLTLRVIYSSGDTVIMKRPLYIEIADCRTPLPSEKANWAFGFYAGMRFTSKGTFRDNGPSLNKVPHNIFLGEGSISISNPQGGKLFYGGGDLFNLGYMNLYNQYYKPFITNPVKGDQSSSQGGIIVTAPGNGSKYYLFSVASFEAQFGNQNNQGFRYSIIDTSVIDTSNASAPSYCEVMAGFKDIPIKAPAGSQFNPIDSALICGELITTIPKCNGRDYWIIVADGSANSSYANQFKLLVYSLDSGTGITFNHISSIKLSLQPGSSIVPGQLKASPDGAILAAPGYVLNFNKITGNITLRDSLLPGYKMWGCSFSPDSKKLYYVSDYVNGYPAILHQYDVDDSTDQHIDTIPVAFYFSMQLGPDNKIYIARPGVKQLAVIKYPNQQYSTSNSTKIGYAIQGPLLGSNGLGGTCQGGLPNFMDAKFPDQIAKKITFTQTGCFTFRFDNSLCCAQSFRWNFGDGDTANGKAVIHTFDSLKSYIVTLIADGDTIRDTIHIGISKPLIAGHLPIVCDSSQVNFYSVSNKEEDYTYTWNVSSPNTLYADNYGGASVTWKQNNSTIKVVAQSPGGCKDSSSGVITIKPIVRDTGIYSDQWICNGSAPLTIQGATPTGGLGTYRYQWYQSTDTGAVKNWTVLSGDTLINYQPPVVTQPTWYVRVTDPQLCPLTSNKVKVDIITFANDSIWLDTSDCDDVLGTTPTVSSGGASYQWERSDNGIFWETIPNETGTELLNPVFFKSTSVRRRTYAHAALCSHVSNVVSPNIFTPDIAHSGDTLCTGATLTMTGNSPCSKNKTISYRWQYRKIGSSDYIDLYGSFGAASNYTHESWTDSCYMRRQMTSFGKTAYSDSVLIRLHPLLINYLFAYGDTTCPGKLQKEIKGSFACFTSKYKYQWQKWIIPTDTNQAPYWQNLSGSWAQGYDYSPPTATQETKYRRRLVYIVTADTTFTEPYIIRIMNPAITQQPSNITAADGELATFSLSTQEMSILRWERDSIVNGFTYWQPLAGPALNTLSFTTDLCMNGRKYRALVKNLCNNTTLYTDEKVLTVTPKNYDLWARDNVNDNNLEPSPGFIWNSPDIWNRRNNDAGTEHQSAEYRISSPNHLRTIIRNEGSQASVPAKLYLYWTFASTGEDWPRCWQSDTSLGSYAGNWANYLGQKRAKGGLIGVYNLNAIQAYSTYQLNTPWTAPDPGIITGDPNSLIPVPVCFLARIVTCQDKPFGMATPEVLNIGANVRNNNNIITKNFYVADSLPGNQYIIPSGHGNPTFAEANGKLRLRAHNCDFFNYGYILLHLDATLQNIWDVANGSGYTVVDDSTLMVETCNEVVLENIAYKAWQQGLIGLEFVMRNDYVIHDPMDVVYNFDLEQFIGEDTVSVGGIEYAIPMHIEPIGNSGYEKRTPVAKKEAPGKVSFAAYPNPFTDELKMAYHLPQAAQVTITVTNLLGQQVASIENKAYKTEGMHKLVFDATNLKEGVYFISFQAGAFVQTRKIVLMR